MIDCTDTARRAAPTRAPFVSDQEQSPTGFLRRIPKGTWDGIDLTTGEESPRRLSTLFGEWADIESMQGPGDLSGLEEDEDLVALKSLHALAIEHFRDMVSTFARVRDDTSLCSDSRLKIAVRVIEPKLHNFAQSTWRETARVAEVIRREEEAIAKAVLVADPSDKAMHAEIRAHIRKLDGKSILALVDLAIRKRDLQTLQAIASAPAYLSGLIVVGGEPHPSYDAAQRALQERLAPKHVHRAAALQAGRTAVLQALFRLNTKAHRFLDFKRAKQLFELEAERGGGC